MKLKNISNLKNGESAFAKEHNRFEDWVYTLVYEDRKYVKKKAFYDRINNILYVEDYSVELPVKEPENVGIAFDALGREVVTMYKNKKGYIYYFNDLTKEYDLENVNCTSIECAITGISMVTTADEELAVIYTNYDNSKDLTNVYVRYQSARYQEEHLYCQVKGKKEVRVVGMTPDYRFLIRFFEKIELIQT